MRRIPQIQRMGQTSGAKMAKQRIKFSYSELPIVRSKHFSDKKEN
jgi:hypothetical protein